MPTKSSRTTYGWCTVADALADGLSDLAVEHFREVETLAAHFPMDIAWGSYQMAERLGEFRAVAARKAGRLVGYAGYFIRPAIHHRNVLWATNAALYLDPDARRGWAGKELLLEAERLLKSVGVQVVVQVDKDTNSTDAPSKAKLGDLLVRTGYFPYERLYAKVLT